MICNKCGNIIQGNDLFCPNCGAQAGGVNTSPAANNMYQTSGDNQTQNNFNGIPSVNGNNYNGNFNQNNGNEPKNIKSIIACILSVVSIAISWYFSMFLGVLIGIIGVVISLISKKSENGKGATIGLVCNLVAICAAIVIFIVTVLLTSAIESGGNNSGSSKDLLKDITITEKTVTPDGRLVVKAKNNNKKAVSVELKANFYDAEGNAVGTNTCYASISSKKENLCHMYLDDIDYSTYDVQVKSPFAYNDYYSKVELLKNDTGESVAGQIKNNSNKELSIDLRIIYFKDGKIIGVDSDSLMDVQNGSTEVFQFDYPYDSNYDYIDFDDYEIYVSAYNMDV